jgi:hypothetical protein
MRSRRQREEQELKRLADNCAKKHNRSCSRAETSGDQLFRKFHHPRFRRGREPHVAVCLLPGTEIAFDENVECEPSFDIGILPNKKIEQRLARFRQINMGALEFPDGQVVLVTRLCVGQRATPQSTASSPIPMPTQSHLSGQKTLARSSPPSNEGTKR